MARELKQRLDMDENDWLTETQVKDYFTQERARRRYGKKQVSKAEIEDTGNLLIAESHAELANTIHESLANRASTDDDPCPIISEGVNLCQLARSIKSSSKLSHSQIEMVEQKKLKKVLESLHIDDFGGGRATKAAMAKIIVRFIEDRCDCLKPL